jgi:ketosteroid isomerase-like protein
MVDDATIDRLREAVDALSEGDPSPFASMFADDAEWRGVSFGHLWWKRTPS